MQANKDQIIYELRNKIIELEAQIEILKLNVREESKLSHSLMKRLGQKDHEVPKT